MATNPIATTPKVQPSRLSSAQGYQGKGTSVVLENISWQQYESLLDLLGDRASNRIAYDRGCLEIMTPLPDHEYLSDSLADAVKDIADALDMDYDCYGSTTWRRELEKAGVEPDQCFYIQNEPLIRGQMAFDLETDPPPDLAIEVDFSSKSLDRFPIYARLGVPEIWRYDNGLLTIHVLENGGYRESRTSLAFPQLPVQELPSLIQGYRSQGKRAMRRAFRQWAQNHR